MRMRTGMLAAAAAVGVVAWAVRDVPAAMGARRFGGREERMRRSTQYLDGRFHNRLPARALPPGSGWQILGDFLFGKHQRRPSGPIPLVDAGTDPPTSDDA